MYFALFSQVFASSLNEELAKSELAKRSLQEYSISHNLEKQWNEKIEPFLKEEAPGVDANLYRGLLFDYLGDKKEIAFPQGFIVSCTHEDERPRHEDIFEIVSIHLVFQIRLGLIRNDVYNRVKLIFPGTDKVEYLPLDKLCL
jgi:hypothetical protein